jgi:Cu(I)/Ag(I) efflux system membrane fusion protein
VREGQKVTVVLSYYPGETFNGTISYIFPYLDTQTRTNKVRLEFANPEGKLKPGMYANSEIVMNLGTPLTVPESAVLQSGLRQLVFVDQGQGVFAPRAVKLGVKADARFVVLNGLTAGERVVTSGNFLLDSESKLQSANSMMGMMSALGMGDVKMESARPMDMGAQTAQAKTAEKKVGTLTVSVSTVAESATLGENSLRIQVKDSTGKPVTDAAVSLDYTMDMPGMMINKAAAKHTTVGIYEAPVRFTMAGPWGITVSIRRPGQTELREHFMVAVAQ